MFEPNGATSLADGGIKIIAGRGRAEFGRVGLSEAFDRVRRQPRFAHRHEVERAQLSCAALGLGIEGADRFQRVAKEIEPDRGRRAGRVKRSRIPPREA